jgi:hypothetical protein
MRLTSARGNPILEREEPGAAFIESMLDGGELTSPDTQTVRWRTSTRDARKPALRATGSSPPSTTG